MTTDLEAVARRECAQMLQIVSEAFRPSTAIESLILVAFAKGASWALDIPTLDEPLDPRRGTEPICDNE